MQTQLIFLSLAYPAPEFMETAKVFLLAAEPSGDSLGAGLARELRALNPKIIVEGIGGTAMSAEDIVSNFDIKPLAIIGFTEAIRALPMVRQKVREARDLILKSSPDAVVLIDSWGFMIRVAEALKKAAFKGQIIKYVSPQVWAMRAGRAKTLAKYVDHLLSIQTMDLPHYETTDLPVTFVGNPMFDAPFAPNQKGSFRERHKTGSSKIMSVLFGSRPAELNHLYEPFIESISQIKQTYPNVEVFSICPPNVRGLLNDLMKNDPRAAHIQFIAGEEKYELYANTDIALASSGTVTTQLAMSGTPCVVAYKLSPVTFAIAGLLFRPKHISLVNISAGDSIIPEFMQTRVKPKNLVPALRAFLDDDEYRKVVSERLIQQTNIMRGKGGSASQRAAQAVLEILAKA